MIGLVVILILMIIIALWLDPPSLTPHDKRTIRDLYKHTPPPVVTESTVECLYMVMETGKLFTISTSPYGNLTMYSEMFPDGIAVYNIQIEGNVEYLGLL